jgi:peptidyl-tRNA hydrolase, PTH1 family
MKKLIVGLGNPEKKYSNTRHNIGYKFVDALYNSITTGGYTTLVPPFFIPYFQNKFDAEAVLLESDSFMYCKKFSHDFVLIKPTSGMNSSGISVSAFVNYYELKSEDVIVIHDDLDLLSGKIKIKQGGGNAGHNGLKSIDAHIGPDYYRIRVGIGRPEKGRSVLEYVLGEFEETDNNWINKVLSHNEEYINRCK